jgi:LacI family transcriptional regulator
VLQEDPLVAEALSYIRANFARDIAMEDVLEELGVSRTTLEKRLKRATGLTPYAALCRERVEQAKRLLLQTRASMNHISQSCGFHDQPLFNRVFKRLTGMAPGEYRHKR